MTATTIFQQPTAPKSMNTQQSQLSFTERYFANDPSIDVLAAFTTDSATQEEVENEAMYIQRNGQFIFEQENH